MRLALTLTRNLQSKLGSTSPRAAIAASFRNYTILSNNPNNNNNNSRSQKHNTITNSNNNNATKKKYTTHSQLPSEHQMVYEMCRKFADEELAPNAGEWDQKHEFPKNAIDKLVRRYAFFIVRIYF